MPLTAADAARKDATTRATMTHQHFATIAAIIANMPVHSLALRTQQESCCWHFTQALAETNPRFDAARFRSACRLANDNREG